MTEVCEARHNRAETMRTYGFSFYTNLSNRLMQGVDTLPVPELGERRFGEHFHRDGYDAIRQNRPNTDVVESRLGLFVVTKGLADDIPDKPAINARADLGITQADLKRFEHITAQHGFLDLGFTWSFAGPLASQSADVLIENGFLTHENVAEMSLADWSLIMDTSWYHTLAHRFAMTGLASYTAAPSRFNMYGWNGLASFITRLERDEEEESLATSKGLLDVRLPENGHIGGINDIEVVATNRLLALLGEGIKRHGDYSSSGCPVARHNTRLPTSMLESDPHTQALIEAGRLVVTKVNEPEQTATVRQLKSAIDIQIDSLSKRLKIYHRASGSPIYEDSGPWEPPLLRWSKRHKVEPVLNSLLNKLTPTASN